MPALSKQASKQHAQMTGHPVKASTDVEDIGVEEVQWPEAAPVSNPATYSEPP